MPFKRKMKTAEMPKRSTRAFTNPRRKIAEDGHPIARKSIKQNAKWSDRAGKRTLVRAFR